MLSQSACGSYSFQNERAFSDVCFLVGKERTKVYANRIILSDSSDVFRQMFCNARSSPESPFAIEIPDCSPAGLANVLRYIYGFDFKFDLAEIGETLAVGDRYQVHKFTDVLFEYVHNELNVSNCCLVYSELFFVPHQTILFGLAEQLIEKYTKEAFEAASFSRIDEVALMHILQLPLNAEPIDQLRCCSVWVDAKAERLGLPASKENRLKLFDPIKAFIRLEKIPVDEIASSEEIQSLLPERDIAQLLSNTDKPHSCQCEMRGAALDAKRSQPTVSAPPLEQSKSLAENKEVSIQFDSSWPNQPNSGQPGGFTRELYLWFRLIFYILGTIYLIWCFLYYLPSNDP